MMKSLFAPAAAALLLLGLTGPVSASTLKVPEDKPAISVDVPDSWKPEDTDKGITCESPDQEATLLFEVSTAKDFEALMDENIDWLAKENKVTVKMDTKKESEEQAAGITWHVTQVEGENKEFGPATIAFVTGVISKSKVVLITYWVTHKGESKHGDTLAKILSSVKVI